MTNMNWLDEYKNCRLCPRECGVNRNEKPGACGVGSKLRVARAALHFWEEPCISGTKGSGTVFFSGCNLGCVYCQNREISRGQSGLEITPERLTEIFFELQDKGANNINLVTADHFLPTIAGAIDEAKRQGIGIPFLLNTSSYIKVDALKRLEGLIDIYLPDFKYIREYDAVRYSKAPGYPETAKAAIAEMVRQQPKCEFVVEHAGGDEIAAEKEDSDKNSIIDERQGLDGLSDNMSDEMKHSKVMLLRRGVVVRHLLLPRQLIQAKMIVNYLYNTYGDSIYISLMSQYTPNHEILAEDYPEIDRIIRDYEYMSLVDHAAELGVTQGFMQEGEAASESFIPPFDNEGV